MLTGKSQVLSPNQNHSFHNPSLRPRSEQHAACRQHRRREERHGVIEEMSEMSWRGENNGEKNNGLC